MYTKGKFITFLHKKYQIKLKGKSICITNFIYLYYLLQGFFHTAHGFVIHSQCQDSRTLNALQQKKNRKLKTKKHW